MFHISQQFYLKWLNILENLQLLLLFQFSEN